MFGGATFMAEVFLSILGYRIAQYNDLYNTPTLTSFPDPSHVVSFTGPTQVSIARSANRKLGAGNKTYRNSTTNVFHTGMDGAVL